MFNMRLFGPMGLLYMNHKIVSCVMQHVSCAFFSSSFSFHFQLLNSVRVGAVHIIFEVAPKEIITEIHVL